MVSDCGRIAPEEHMAEDEAHYRACTECTCVCQTTHGKGLPRSVPKFSRSIPEYTLPSKKDCNMQIPAPFVREHIANVSKREYILVGVTGSEWRVTFKDIALKDGWKAFATEYRLEKGDRVVFALIAPNRFYVDVFNRFGLEKNPVDLRRTAVKEIPQLCLRNESPVSNFTNRADGTRQPTPTRELKPNVSAPSSGKASDQNINHDEKLSRLPYKRALTEKDHLSHELVENPDAEPPSTSLSSIASDDSVQVRLAKAVLLKSKQKKLKKRKMSCTSSPQVEAVVETAKCDGTSGAEEPELCMNLHEDKALEVTSVEDRICKGVAILSSCVDPAGSSMGKDVETVFTKPCDDSIVGVSNDDELKPDVGHEPQNFSNRVPDQPEEAVSQMVALPDQRQNDTLDETETFRGATGEDPVLEGSEIRQVEELQPSRVFQPGLVKPEPDLVVAEPLPYRACKKCTNCGLFRKETSPIHTRDLKPEPVTSESPITEDQKQQALTAAKVFSATLPNRHATVIMRVGFNEKTYDCFVSLNCSEMLPSEATEELILLDSECVSYKAHWNADRRYLQGPGWRDFVDSHKLQINDVFVMELLERSEQRCVVLTHIFHAHEMVNLSVSASPGVTGNVQATPAGSKRRSSNLLHGCSPILTNKRAKALEILKAVQIELPNPRASSDNAEYYPEPSISRISRRTSSSSPLTPGRARATDVTPSSTNQITRVSSPNVDAAVVGTQLIVGPLPVASTADTTRADTESPGLSTTTRSKMMSSSHGNPAIASLASVPISDTGVESSRALNREQAKLAVRAKQKALRERAKLYSPHVRKKGDPKPSKATMQQRQRHRSTDESKKQVRTRTSQKVQYPVAKMLDRRKSVQGNVLFLVELGKLVSQSSIHKRMKAKQDGKGRWWVPHHHFTKDFTSCFIE